MAPSVGFEPTTSWLTAKSPHLGQLLGIKLEDGEGIEPLTHGLKARCPSKVAVRSPSTIIGVVGRIRTYTRLFLRQPPLPIGLQRHLVDLRGFEPRLQQCKCYVPPTTL